MIQVHRAALFGVMIRIRSVQQKERLQHFVPVVLLYFAAVLVGILEGA